MNKSLLSHETDRWFTPEWLYRRLNDEFHFDHDPSLKGKIDWANDGLNTEWGKSTFCNPPYSDLARWISKAYREYQKGKIVVMLIPSRTDTRAWHDYVMKSSEVRLIRGRITFEGAKQGAPFPSCIVIFSPIINKGGFPENETRFVSMSQEQDPDWIDF